MLNRFTGTDERKAGLVAGVPLKRVGRPEEIAQTIRIAYSPRRLLASAKRVEWEKKLKRRSSELHRRCKVRLSEISEEFAIVSVQR
jgi:hypothetical protein